MPISRVQKNKLDIHTEIVVSPEDDVEMRRTQITNNSDKKRTIEITSYAEVVITQAAADSSHPAFSNLFVQTEILEQKNAILCTPPGLSQTDEKQFLLDATPNERAWQRCRADIACKTDRMAFIGRGNTLSNPQ